MIIQRLLRTFKIYICSIKKNQNIQQIASNYRLLEVIKDDNDGYKAAIQIVNKSQIFYATPEKILSDDKLIDQFSPRDVRALTYLGYLGIHGPKYKILAQRLAENDKIVFLIKKKGDKNVATQTAKEIMQNNGIISNMNPGDANIVGFALASEQITEEQSQLLIVQNNLSKNINWDIEN